MVIDLPFFDHSTSSVSYSYILFTEFLCFALKEQTPLHTAVSAGHENVVDLLIRNKANLNASDVFVSIYCCEFLIIEETNTI